MDPSAAFATYKFLPIAFWQNGKLLVERKCFTVSKYTLFFWVDTDNKALHDNYGSAFQVFAFKQSFYEVDHDNNIA